MYEINLTATPALGQVDAIGFKSVSVINLSGTNPSGIMPGDLIELVCQGGAPNRMEIGVLWPWQPQSLSSYTPMPTTDASGNVSYGPVTCSASAGTGPWSGAGMLLAVGVLPGGGVNPWGYSTCAYQVPAPPIPAVPASFASFIGDVEASWNTHIPVVDYYLPSNWTVGSYQANTPFSPTPVTVTFTLPLALSVAAADILAVVMGGKAYTQPPLEADYPQYYEEPSPVVGSLTPIPYIQAMVPLGASGALVQASAAAGKIVAAMAYGRQTGLQAMVLSCFEVGS